MVQMDLGSYIFMFLNEDYRCNHERSSFTVSAYNFYRITVTDSVRLYKAKLNDKSGKVLEEGEWNRFSQFWEVSTSIACSGGGFVELEFWLLQPPVSSGCGMREVTTSIACSGGGLDL